MKNLIINASIMLFTVLITFFIAEYALRWALFKSGDSFWNLKKPFLYSDHIKHKHEEFFNDDYWKIKNMMKHDFQVEKPDSLLGWWGFFEPNTYIPWGIQKLENKRPVLLYGDSFSMCIKQVDCFEDILNSDSTFNKSHHLFNYGVGAYGVDQIYLLFNETVDRFEKPFVIFGFLTTDLDRSMLTIRDSQKPYFKLENDELELYGPPFTLPTDKWIEENPPKIKSYLWNRFKSSDFFPIKPSKNRELDYIEEIKTLNTKILKQAFKKLKSFGDNYVVLLFQPGDHPVTEWRLHYARDLFEKHNIPYICDLDIRMADTNYTDYDIDRYVVKGDGHPTTYLNQLISNELKEYILNLNFRKIIKERNQNWKQTLIYNKTEVSKQDDSLNKTELNSLEK